MSIEVQIRKYRSIGCVFSAPFLICIFKKRVVLIDYRIAMGYGKIIDRFRRTLGVINDENRFN